MKKIFSVLIAVVMVLSLSAVAFAEDSDGKITVTNATDGQTYTAYRILDLETFDKVAGAYTYKTTAAWKAFIESADVKDVYLTIDDDGVIKWIEGADIVKFARIAKAHAKDSGITGDKLAIADNGKAEISGLAHGWYLVDSTVGTICSINTTDTEVEIEDKNEKPSIDKEVKEDSDGSWGKTNDADIGQVVNFRTTVTKQKGAINYRVHDKMEAGLTLDVESIVTEDPNADIITTGLTDGCTFEVLFSNDYIASLTDGAATVITYSATLNKNAEISGNSNDNDTKLSYGVNEDMDTEWIKTQTYTYTFDLVKTNNENVKIENAEFKLYKADGTTEIPVVKLEDGLYRVAVEGETGVSIVAGKSTIKGLDSDTYKLEETKAPEGYNKLDKQIEFVIDHANNTANPLLTGNKFDKSGNGVQVINNSGTVLPSTGGMGTTIFTVTGIILIVGAAIVLFARKRMSYSA